MARRYNYIFRSSDPAWRRKQAQKKAKAEAREAQKQRQKFGYGAGKIPVYVPELGRTYESIAAAAADLGINASNISKVISGSRKSAGGLHFELAASQPEPWTPEEPSQDEQKELYKHLIQKVIEDTNKLIEDARGRKLQGFLDDLNDLEDFATSILGETGDNLIDDQSDVLDDMDLDELKQLDKVLNEKYIKAKADVEKADERLQGYADVFGTSSNEMQKYEHLIPEINRTVDRAARNSDGSNIWYMIKDAIGRNVSPDDIRDLLQKVNDYYDNKPKRTKKGQKLKDVLNDWERRVYGDKTYEDLEDEDIY